MHSRGLSTGCVVLSGTIGGGEIVLRLLCDKDSLERLLSLSSVEVKSIRNYSEVTVLTPREEEVLRMAYELDYKILRESVRKMFGF